MDNSWFERQDRLFGTLAVGMTAFGGGLWFLSPSDLKDHFADERRAAAALLAVTAAFFFAGFPAGWRGGKYFPESLLPVWLAMAGSCLVPVAVWFAGLEPAWPVCLAWAWGLAYAGNWVGLAV
jgi:hypothetical protein